MFPSTRHRFDNKYEISTTVGGVRGNFLKLEEEQVLGVSANKFIRNVCDTERK